MQGQREYWDREAEHFDQEPDHGLLDPLIRDSWRTLIRSVVPERCRSGLDLGCGTGTLTVLLAEMGLDMTGVDLAPNMIEQARRKALRAGLEVTLYVGDASHPAMAEEFDLLLCRHLLWALPEPQEALSNWRSLAREGTTLLVIEGRWSTGGGLTSSEAIELVGQHFTISEVHALRDPGLWGNEISDERYLIVADA